MCAPSSSAPESFPRDWPPRNRDQREENGRLGSEGDQDTRCGIYILPSTADGGARHPHVLDADVVRHQTVGGVGEVVDALVGKGGYGVGVDGDQVGHLT